MTTTPTYRPGDEVAVSHHAGTYFVRGRMSGNGWYLLSSQAHGAAYIMLPEDHLTMLNPAPSASREHVTDFHSTPKRRGWGIPAAILAGTVILGAAVTGTLLYTTAQSRTDESFEQVVVAAGIPTSAVPEAQAAAQAFCDLLDSGMSYRSAVGEVVSASGALSTTQLGAVIGGGVAAYCPEYQADIR
jgi:hypothetical protein